MEVAQLTDHAIVVSFHSSHMIRSLSPWLQITIHDLVSKLGRYNHTMVDVYVQQLGINARFSWHSIYMHYGGSKR